MQNYLLISFLRVEKKLSQKDMAELLKVSLTTYKGYEKGLHLMGIEEINFLSNYFNISINSLLNITRNTISCNNEFNINYKLLSFNLHYFRKKKHYTQKHLAKKLNTSVHSISKYEKNAQNINIRHLYNFAKYFNLSIDYLCGKTTKKEV